jgi:hypothetical protein
MAHVAPRHQARRSPCHARTERFAAGGSNAAHRSNRWPWLYGGEPPVGKALRLPSFLLFSVFQPPWWKVGGASAVFGQQLALGLYFPSLIYFC